MAYLSRIWLNPWRNKTRLFFRDPQALHAAVLGGLPNQPVSERVLWRLDGGDAKVIDGPSPTMSSPQGRNVHRLGLFVVTRSAPSWEHMVEQAGWPSADDAEPQVVVREYGPLLQRLNPGDRYAFRLTANPTTSVRPSSDGETKRGRGKRVAHVTIRQQLAWLANKSERSGFEIPVVSSSTFDDDSPIDARVVDRQKWTFSKGKGKGKRVTISTATFEGGLVVRDPERFRAALLDGIGPAKAYGCGLLTLAPVGDRR